ncbi:MAG: molecular chaperone [Halomonas sp.]|uniref:fimbrial biogenesis chaperone n=1 Tax=Halomonas sp. TaxID=1486246 RepID=UPI00182254D4|nr:fimbria/pilus periplasmic chaperone [Halomonas sp.]NWN84161.1 molecular chaperone [Halomonas sp.]
MVCTLLTGWRLLHRLLGLLLAALLGVSALPAAASGLSVAPTLLEFAPGETAKGLTLRNTGSETLQAQVRVFDWRQENGENILEPSTGLVVSPPFLSVPPGGWQVVRVLQRGSSSQDTTTGERSFRILVDEMPSGIVDDEGAAGGQGRSYGVRPGLNFLMRFSIPVFVMADSGVAHELQWRLQDAGQGPRLMAENTGSHRAQISDLELVDDDGRILYRHDGLAGYLLPGTSRQWAFNLPNRAAVATETRMRVNGQPTRHRLAPSGTVD